MKGSSSTPHYFSSLSAPFDLWHREGARGLKLYVQRTFIMDEAEQFLPMYLRFVKGVLDSSDLSSECLGEILQQNQQVESIRGALTKRVLDMLSKMASKQPEDYQRFWDTFGVVLKEVRRRISPIARKSPIYCGFPPPGMTTRRSEFR
ncbi:MAG: hypothetical protein CM15mP74_10750 [Halieaceae bacterium]|nr:MAG: hypothetical protein CM15mP74_10750 [Halieaceae bacterium]